MQRLGYKEMGNGFIEIFDVYRPVTMEANICYLIKPVGEEVITLEFPFDIEDTREGYIYWARASWSIYRYFKETRGR